MILGWRGYYVKCIMNIYVYIFFVLFNFLKASYPYKLESLGEGERVVGRGVGCIKTSYYFTNAFVLLPSWLISKSKCRGKYYLSSLSIGGHTERKKTKTNHMAITLRPWKKFFSVWLVHIMEYFFCVVLHLYI